MISSYDTHNRSPLEFFSVIVCSVYSVFSDYSGIPDYLDISTMIIVRISRELVIGDGSGMNRLQRRSRSREPRIDKAHSEFLSGTINCRPVRI